MLVSRTPDVIVCSRKHTQTWKEYSHQSFISHKDNKSFSCRKSFGMHQFTRISTTNLNESCLVIFWIFFGKICEYFFQHFWNIFFNILLKKNVFIFFLKEDADKSLLNLIELNQIWIVIYTFQWLICVDYNRSFLRFRTRFRKDFSVSRPESAIIRYSINAGWQL